MPKIMQDSTRQRKMLSGPQQLVEQLVDVLPPLLKKRRRE